MINMAINFYPITCANVMVKPVFKDVTHTKLLSLNQADDSRFSTDASTTSNMDLNIFKRSRNNARHKCQLLFACMRDAPTSYWEYSYQLSLPFCARTLSVDVAACSTPWTTSVEPIYNRSHLRLNWEDGTWQKVPALILWWMQSAVTVTAATTKC